VAALRWGTGHHHLALVELSTVFGLLGASVLLAWLLGDSVRWRRGYYDALEERAERLERERDALAQVAVATERARIAREMHDVVAHHVSVMVVQADGAAFALDDSPDKARQAMSAISRTGRQALNEMRRLLGVLRTADIGPALLEPMPGVGELGDLVTQTEAGGIPVCVSVEGVPRPLDGGADLAAYRIVQESLTNVRKHGGPGVSVDITLRFCEEWLTIRVNDDGRGAACVTAPAGDGHGLAGMRERVELYGGTVAAGPRQGGGFQVLARLPLRAAA
jgi:signal transduction histidine kinase